MTFNLLPNLITGITNACPAVVTTETDHGFYTGIVVKMVVPPAYGMIQVNNQYFQVTVLTDMTFSLQYSQAPPMLNVNSVNFYPFILAVGQRFTAQVIPVGSGPTPITDVPWQTNNGYCESTLDDTLLNNSTVEIPF